MDGNKVRALRIKNLLSIDEFAEKLGVRTETIWHWENNKVNPTMKHLKKIAKVLKVDPQEIL